MVIPLISSGQWITQNLPDTSASRVDDIFFLNDSVGWAAGGWSGKIYKTIDGGDNWKVALTTNDYLRSIEFATDQLGFCGSLDSAFYITTDGGDTWTDIADTVHKGLQGVCGISSPSASVTYGVGIWISPAFVIKTSNGGTTWSFIDMSAYAEALVDVHFINEMEGFVSGQSSSAGAGGIILYTDDGGVSWTIKYQTGGPGDYIWKIQTPNGKHYFGSIQSSPSIDNIRYVQSSDSGNTWQQDTIRDTYHYIQMIGFMNAQNGWMGGTDLLLETSDGGTTWDTLDFSGNTFNRFLKVNDHYAFLTGEKIYRYYDSIPYQHIESQIRSDQIALNLWPNPIADELNIEIDLQRKTWLSVDIYAIRGNLIEQVWKGYAENGLHIFNVDFSKHEAVSYFLIVHTNDEMVFKQFLKN